MPSEKEVTEKISTFLRRNFPQIQMHGGESSITDINLEEKSVEIYLGGACSGCGVSPMTTQAIKRRLCQEVDEIDIVTVQTGEHNLSRNSPTLPDSSSAMKDKSPEAPF